MPTYKEKVDARAARNPLVYPLLYPIMSAGKFLLYTFTGFFRFYFSKPRSIVLVYSSMRTGSTLLKSLIGEAADVSLIDEFNFLPYITRNKYLFYALVCSLARERVIVLKKPYNNNSDYLDTYGTSPMQGVKKIVLYREPFDTLCSLRNLQLRRHKRVFSDEELISYWCDCYESVLNNTQNSKVLIVKYEELTSHPKMVTGKIFSYIGSERSDGVDHYSEYEWFGGRDDVSDTIRGLKVADARQNSPQDNPSLFDMLENSARVKDLLERLDSAKNQK